MVDYFIDFDFISLSALRAIFGIWINVCVAIIAISIRSIFRHRIKRILLSGRRRVNLWRVSPALTTSEFYELRHVLIRALIHGHYFFVLTSMSRVVVALVGAASTVISNYSVVTNPVIRDVIVPGQNVTHFVNAMEGAAFEVSSRVKALDRANAPMDELFDFVPDDNFPWIYTASQWNNTWKGTCTFTKHQAVELVLSPINASFNVPLPEYIPRWAGQGASYVGWWDWDRDKSKPLNAQGPKWWTILVTYVSGSSPDSDDSYSFQEKTFNISIVNILAPRVKVPDTGWFTETAFRSDVHVAECVNTLENGTVYQANAGGSYTNAAFFINGMFDREFVMNVTANRTIIQPTGMQMLRYWQAYLSVRDSLYPNPAVRNLAVQQDMVQMRLSSLVVTVGSFLLAVIAACVVKYRGVKHKTSRIQLPSSQLDWIVQSAREHAKTNSETGKTQSQTKSPLAEFAIRNPDDFFIVAPNFDPCIAMGSEPGLLILDPLSSGLQSSHEEEDYDPWVGFEETYSFQHRESESSVRTNQGPFV